MGLGFKLGVRCCAPVRPGVLCPWGLGLGFCGQTLGKYLCGWAVVARAVLTDDFAITRRKEGP